jgi:D-alanyl-D-alanine carboxypeptidase.
MEQVRTYLASIGVPARVTSTVRSRAEQERLYAGRAHNRYPVARPGTSAHERGLAFDISAPEWALTMAGLMAPTWGLRWSAADPVHFQAADA